MIGKRDSESANAILRRLLFLNFALINGYLWWLLVTGYWLLLVSSFRGNEVWKLWKPTRVRIGSDANSNLSRRIKEKSRPLKLASLNLSRYYLAAVSCWFA